MDSLDLPCALHRFRVSILAIVFGRLWLFCLAAVLAAGAPRATAALPERTQTIDLKSGWNAVFLEVEPPDTSPATVFANSPVDVAAQFTRPVRLTRFATDPAEILANNDGWSVWYAPERQESFLSNLFALHSHNAFLVHSRSDHQLKVTGQVYLKRLHWKADSFNLMGFPVDPAAAPTFAEYFQGVPAHSGQPVFRLVDGKWRKVVNPAGTPMRRGEAYWVFSKGGSDYQGPGEVRLAYGDHLRYGPDRFNSTMVLSNRSRNPVKATISQAAQGGVGLDFVFKGILESEVKTFLTPLPQTYNMPAMEAGTEGSVILRLTEAASYPAGRSNLLRVTFDAGTEYWISVYLDPQN